MSCWHERTRISRARNNVPVGQMSGDARDEQMGMTDVNGAATYLSHRRWRQRYGASRRNVSRMGWMVLPALVLLAPAVTNAQIITGFVTRGVTGQPVRGARVLLLQASIAIDSAESNAAGLVTFVAPAAGGLTIVAGHVGYEPATSDLFTMTAASNQFVEIQLVPNSVELDPLWSRPTGRYATWSYRGSTIDRR